MTTSWKWAFFWEHTVTWKFPKLDAGVWKVIIICLFHVHSIRPMICYNKFISKKHIKRSEDLAVTASPYMAANWQDDRSTDLLHVAKV